MIEPRILIVENDSALRQKLYRGMLDVELFSDCAADAREALGHLALRRYSVVLLDLDIVGGSETIIAAVSKMANSQQPIIFATAADRIGRIDAEGVQVVMRGRCACAKSRS